MRECPQKVTAAHLDRKAYLYVRQSTLRQVLENRESTQRQYALRDRAVALGWTPDQVVVIDSDLGQSGASADREGFQRLVAEVGTGRAGIVLGLEVSRLARNCSDWHRLLEICALTNTLILDEDGLYDPCQFNDRLLLGLKGSMSEAELHVLQARLHGGVLNKARRGELKTPLPVGFLHGPDDKVVLDPDKQVQETLHLFFATFRRLRSASATVKALREQGLLFPRRLRTGHGKGQLVWVRPTSGIALSALHNPRYAGAFFYGRRPAVRGADGKQRQVNIPAEEWQFLIPEAHAGYISWTEYQENLRCLQENANTLDSCRWSYPPREGPALLQGLALCGVCGCRMTPRYVVPSSGPVVPYYTCLGGSRERVCQSIQGATVDEALEALLLEMVSPLALEATLAVQEELKSRLDEADRLRRLGVERAQYDADLAKRRFLQVDPENRLVADALESDWNSRLRDLRAAQEEYERLREADQQTLTDEQQQAIRALAEDFPRLWKQPGIPCQERKRMVRLLVEDVTLLKTDKIAVHVRFRGGTSHSLELPIPLNAGQMRKTRPEVVQAIDELLEDYTEREIAQLLNERGLRTGEGKSFTTGLVQDVRDYYRLSTRFDRLRKRGLLTKEEAAKKLGLAPSSVMSLRKRGRLKAHRVNEKGLYLYEEPIYVPSRVSSRHTDPAILRAIDELLEDHTEHEIAQMLNERGLHPGEGGLFTAKKVQWLRQSHGLTARRDRLLVSGAVMPSLPSSAIRGSLG